MANVMSGQERTASSWSIPLSILMIVAGLLAIALPLVAGFVVATLVGWLLLFSAVLHLGFAWRSGTARGVVWEILVAIVYGFIGLYILAQPAVGLASLTFAVAVYLFFEGVLELMLSFQHRSAPGAGWLLVDGIITLVLGLMIWSTWPSSSEWVIGTLVGISMLFSGVTRLMLSRGVPGTAGGSPAVSGARS